MIAKLPEAETIVADKGYDSERVREQVEQQGAKAVIPRKRNTVCGPMQRSILSRLLVSNAAIPALGFGYVKGFVGCRQQTLQVAFTGFQAGDADAYRDRFVGDLKRLDLIMHALGDIAGFSEIGVG